MGKLMEYIGIIFLVVTKLINDRKDDENKRIVEMLDTVEELLSPVIRQITGINDELLN